MNTQQRNASRRIIVVTATLGCLCASSCRTRTSAQETSAGPSVAAQPGTSADQIDDDHSMVRDVHPRTIEDIGSDVDELNGLDRAIPTSVDEDTDSVATARDGDADDVEADHSPSENNTPPAVQQDDWGDDAVPYDDIPPEPSDDQSDTGGDIVDNEDVW